MTLMSPQQLALNLAWPWNHIGCPKLCVLPEKLHSQCKWVDMPMPEVQEERHQEACEWRTPEPLGPLHCQGLLQCHHISEGTLTLQLWNAEGLEGLQKGQASSQKMMVSSFPSQALDHARTIFRWIELVALCDDPVSVFENIVHRKHIKLDSISRATLCKHHIMLACIVGPLIKEEIGPGCCAADGWSCSLVHCFAIVHRWPFCHKSGCVGV